MRVPKITEQQFAEIFTAVNQENINQDLKIKYLNVEATKKTICEFTQKNQNTIKKYYNNWYDKELYTNIINYLISAQKSGVFLEMTAEQYIDYLTEKMHKHTCVE